MTEDANNVGIHQQTTCDHADLIIDYIRLLGVEFVFGVPGGAIEPFYNALARSERRGELKAIVARHESGAAFMADGYYRETGKLAVVCATTGPGTTNLVTGIASAYVDRTPMLVITAQTALPKFGHRPFQDSSETAIDTVSILRSCTKFNALVSHPAQLEVKLVAALIEALNPPKGPVHLSIPADIFRTIQAEKNDQVDVSYLLYESTLVDTQAIKLLIKAIRQAKNIIIYIGHGCNGVYQHIEQLAELLNAPMVSGPMGKCWVNEQHPLYYGVYGYAGHSSASQLFADNANIDMVLAIGTTITEMGLGNLNSNIMTKLVHIDENIENFSRSAAAKLHVGGHLNTIFTSLLNALYQDEPIKPMLTVERSKNVLGNYVTLLEPQKCQMRSAPIKPQALMASLAIRLPKNCRVFIDAGNAWAWATHYFSHCANEGLYRVSMDFGSMAWAISSVVGSALAVPNEPHVCICGDGAWLMSSHEISVAVQYKLPILIIVLNDSALGMIRFGQKLSKAESIGWQLNQVDFSLLAQAHGAQGIIIDTPEQLQNLDFSVIFSAEAPTLLDVRIDKEEIPPMMARIKHLVGRVN